MKRVTVLALVVAGRGQMVVTVLESGYNTEVGLTIGLVFLGLAGAAATGRWWVLGLVALLSGLLTVAAIGQLSESIEEGSTGEMLRVLAFQGLTLTAAIAGTAAATRAYRTSHAK